MNTLPSLREILRKDNKRARKRLPGLRGLGRKEKMPALPDPDEGPERLANLVNDELQRLANALDDMQLAKKILELKKEHPHATVPELVTIEWLERRNTKWGFQVWALGGRKHKGGQVLDLIVDRGNGIIILEVQGNYWHNRPGQSKADRAQKFALMGIKIWGKRVMAVVEVWESRLMNKKQRNAVLEMAMQGVELGM